MRCIYTLTLLLYCLVSFGQIKVPNHDHFTIGQVTNVIYGDSTVGRNTSTLFTDSNSGKFDLTYGSKTMSPQTINGFRNYGATVTNSLTFVYGSGTGSAVMYLGGYFVITITYNEYDIDYIIAQIFNGSGGYVATEYISTSGNLSHTLQSNYTVNFYVYEVEPTTTYYSAAVDKWFEANDGHCTSYSYENCGTCNGQLGSTRTSCLAEGKTWVPLGGNAYYHAIYAYGTFTSTISQADADAQAQAAGQAAANSAECVCNIVPQ